MLLRTARVFYTLTRPPLRAAYSTVQGPDAVLIRPHPALWRLWHGVGVTYMLFLVFLLFQTPAGARAFMKVWLQALRSLLCSCRFCCCVCTHLPAADARCACHRARAAPVALAGRGADGARVR